MIGIFSWLGSSLRPTQENRRNTADVSFVLCVLWGKSRHGVWLASLTSPQSAWLCEG